jgi:hypothetical protein
MDSAINTVDVLWWSLQQGGETNGANHTVTERAASLLVLSKLCSILFFYVLFLSVSPENLKCTAGKNFCISEQLQFTSATTRNTTFSKRILCLDHLFELIPEADLKHLHRSDFGGAHTTHRF